MNYYKYFNIIFDSHEIKIKLEHQIFMFMHLNPWLYFIIYLSFDYELSDIIFF